MMSETQYEPMAWGMSLSEVVDIARHNLKVDINNGRLQHLNPFQCQINIDQPILLLHQIGQSYFGDLTIFRGFDLSDDLFFWGRQCYCIHFNSKNIDGPYATEREGLIRSFADNIYVGERFIRNALNRRKELVHNMSFRETLIDLVKSIQTPHQKL